MSYSFELRIPYIFFFRDDRLSAVPTFVGSTLLACFLLTYMPALVPLWTVWAVNPGKVVK